MLFASVVRIAINAALVGRRHSGVTTYIVGLINCIRDLGHDVVVYGSSLHIPKGKGIEVAETPSGLTFDKGSFAAVLRFTWNQIILPIRLWRDDVDVLVSQNADGSLWSPVPQVLIVHDLIPLLYPDEAPRLRFYYRWMFPFLLRQMTAILTVSEHTRNDMVRHYGIDPMKVRVAYNGLRWSVTDSMKERKPMDLRFDRYFLFVGNFARRKNLKTVTEAFASICEGLIENLVVVAYPDEWSCEYLELIDSLGLADRVAILNDLQNDELAYVYRHASALFLLSEYEGFGYPALEAMLIGAAAVVSDSTSLAEIVGDAAIKINAHDLNAAAEAMERLSSDQEYRREFQRLGFERAKCFTWDSTATSLSETLALIVPK